MDDGPNIEKGDGYNEVGGRGIRFRRVLVSRVGIRPMAVARVRQAQADVRPPRFPSAPETFLPADSRRKRPRGRFFRPPLGNARRRHERCRRPFTPPDRNPPVSRGVPGSGASSSRKGRQFPSPEWHVHGGGRARLLRVDPPWETAEDRGGWGGKLEPPGGDGV